MHKRSKRKGALEEVIAYARFADDLSKYRVLYRDFDQVVGASLQAFLEQDDPPIPWHRIHVIMVTEDETTRAVYVKHGHCPRCGQKLEVGKEICYQCGYIVEP
jgi:hypothetical protein